MTNVTWTKDRAASLALAILNRPKTAQETRAKAPPIASGGSAATSRRRRPKDTGSSSLGPNRSTATR
jgi:hypothetical protein